MPKKWDGDATPSEKLLQLFALLLYNKRSFSLSELSSPERLNASKATVIRLLRRLDQAKIGMLIREKIGRESYYRLEHKQPPQPSLNPEAIAQLALCRNFILHLLPEDLADSTAMALAQLGWQTDNYALAAASVVKGKIDYTPFRDIFLTLEKAIISRAVCRVTYLAAQNEEVRAYLFAPARFLTYHEIIYVEGWLLENPDQRKYKDPLRLALQRFKHCELTDFSAADLPNLPLFNRDCFGLVEDEPFTARIWFARESAAYISERTWSADQQLEKQADGSVILTVRICSLHEGVAWIMGFGDKAIVQEPEDFVRAVRRTLRHAVQNYRRIKEIMGNGEE